MKRDMDLIRGILMQMEDSGDTAGWVTLHLPKWEDHVVSYHIKMLNQAGLIEADEDSTFSPHESWKAGALTWHGHDFLAAIKNEKVWERIKKVVREKGGSIPFEVLKELATKYARQYFNGGG